MLAMYLLCIGFCLTIVYFIPMFHGAKIPLPTMNNALIIIFIQSTAISNYICKTATIAFVHL